jgi:N-acetylmuramoyl-L-alanine amidase
MPAVLVEGGFLSNAEEARKLRNPGYIRFLAWSIAKGIDDFIRKK